ncbi:23S rRNA (guanosine(2251)-2'-O)-methyltransferase RlmB [Ruminiclostridium josui]|uniref:23S rRNA (guanosine(2251)-2'-O)-methyltransferase RlmB n=1 Tax=Ruminiclostridium josui TaxID=1499 RepID=UPI000466AEF4|nr:23S rRNA (guanosine(2251)-2'-O)-methyltransferase RlmB [Ruminiclostridium josui]
MAEARNRKSGNSRFDRKNFSGDSKKRGIKGDERKGFKSESAKRGFYGAPVKNTEFENLEMVNAVPEESDKLEGRNSVMEALKANRTINKLFIAKGEKEGSIRQIIAIARQKGIITTEVDKNILDGMSTTRSHQGVIAYVAVKEYVEVDDILAAAQEKGEPPFIIILDEISDPHNFGAILRTANAVGAHGVIIPKRRAIGLTSTVSKASAGAVEYVPVSRVTNISQTIEYLKKNNVWVVGTDSTGEKAFYESDLKGPIALVVGSEGEGMGKLVREKCDFVVNIPMHGEISSLNASVAAAIVMYEILKQRGK